MQYNSAPDALAAISDPANKIAVISATPANLKALSSNIDDAIDAAGLPLLGVIPEDEGIPIALGRSALTVFSRESSAEIACRNIARRLTGERVPLMKLPRR